MSLIAKLHDIAEHAPEAMVVMSEDGQISGWNARAEALFGWGATEMFGRRLTDLLVSTPDSNADETVVARYLDGRTCGRAAQPIEATALRRDGTQFPVQLSRTTVDDGYQVAVVGFMRDLSELHEARTALRRSETQLGSLIENLPGVAYIHGPGGAGRYVSPQVEAILGYTPEKWLADEQLWSRILHDEDRDRAHAELAAGEASGAAFASLYRLTTRDGQTVWIRDQARVVRDEHGDSEVHGIMFDVTREMSAEANLQFELAERQRTGEALRRLTATGTAEETAAAVCCELLELPHVDTAVVYEFAQDGSVVPLAQVSPGKSPLKIGQSIPAERAAYLRESATGPWIDEWRPRPEDGAYQKAWHRIGLRVAAYVPFGTEEVVHGLLALGSTEAVGTREATKWLAAAAEIAAVAGALLIRELGLRRKHDGKRARLEAIIRNGEFSSVFQPISRLGDGTVVGFEALTRFADGSGPEQRFAQAEAIGMGHELEVATIRASLLAAAALPPRAWVSVNVSPTRLADRRLLRHLSVAGRRPVVVEITERLAIDDYAAARDALDQLGRSVDVAVDDAGAGFASLRHIIELRPRYVKLDIALVHSVDSDPARQALVAGMVYFARETGCLLIAEGVETPAERDTLRRLGVPFGQGFLFGRPAPAPAFSLPPRVRARATALREAAETVT